jgi:hypothetical protein
MKDVEDMESSDADNEIDDDETNDVDDVDSSESEEHCSDDEPEDDPWDLGDEAGWEYELNEEEHVDDKFPEEEFDGDGYDNAMKDEDEDE